MLGRRDMAMAAVALAAAGVTTEDLPSEEALLHFRPLGQVTLLHLADLHGQLVPMHFREAEINVGVGQERGALPYLTGEALLRRLQIRRGSPLAYALSDLDFDRLAKRYGPMGGLDRIARLITAIRAERPGRTLLLDGGDTLQGSWTALQTRGADMVAVLNHLGVDATTAHWEFTYGSERVKELVTLMRYPLLASNVQDGEWEDDVFPHTAFFDRGGVRVAVIGQAFPYTPIANPRWLIPEWRFGIKEEKLAERVRAARAAGAELVVMLSHNGFSVDRLLARRIEGIDVILTAHTHDALPFPLQVGRTLLLASGCHGKFLGRLDLAIGREGIRAWRHALIPVFAEALHPDPETAALIAQLRRPFRGELERIVAYTETTLWRRGNLAGTMDGLICAALLRERDAEIALSPAFRWGYALPAGSAVTAEDIYAHTAITYPAAYRMVMTGQALKALLEDVADNLFNPDPYYRQGGDMVRSLGLSYVLDVDAPRGRRIVDLRLTQSGEPIEAERRYVVAGWGSVAEGIDGPPIWEVVFRYLEDHPRLRLSPPEEVRLRIG